MLNRSANIEELPLNIVGSSSFGRYPTISNERTVNMFESDGWLVSYAGYKSIINNFNGKGRGIFANSNNKMIVVYGNIAYLINIIVNVQTDNYTYDVSEIGVLQSSTGTVWIAENNTGQTVFSDNQSLYLYQPTSLTPFKVLNIDFIPGRVIFQNGYILCASLRTNEWRLSLLNDASMFPFDSQHIGTIETKADKCIAVIKPPQGGNLAFVFGNNCVELWFNTGNQLFPYQRNQSFNIDYGAIKPETIATIDNLVVWLAKNEKSGLVIMFSTGSNVEKITTDGIDFFFSNLENPSNCEAFIYRQDGHIFYHLNFYTDNVSLFYDFTNGKFYHASDENGNYFIASGVAFLNNQYYFFSKDNNVLYALDTIYTTYDGKEIPRIRICKNYRRQDERPSKIREFGFPLEQGTTDYNFQNLGAYEIATSENKLVFTSSGNQVITKRNQIRSYTPRLDCSISKNGGISFGNYVSKNLNNIGKYQNIVRFYNAGKSNSFTPQFRFYNMGRVVATNGYLLMEKM